MLKRSAYLVISPLTLSPEIGGEIDEIDKLDKVWKIAQSMRSVLYTTNAGRYNAFVPSTSYLCT